MSNGRSAGRARITLCVAACALATAAHPAVAQRPLGLDLSHWNGDITAEEWIQIRDSGRVFAFTKASEGDNGTYNDPTLGPNMVNGRAAGVLMGAYHFARPEVNAAVPEANQFLSVARGYLTGGYLRPVLDLESGGVGTTAGRTYLSNWVNDWMNTVTQQTGVEPMLYCNTNYAQNYLNSTVASRTLWIANWPANPDPQNGSPPTGLWSGWSFWQYGGGSVPGTGGSVDLDVFNGTMTALQGFVIPSSCSYADDYPYPTQSYLSADPWLFYYRECTSYVAWRMNRDHGTTNSPYYFTNYMLGGHWGNAGNWASNATALGFAVGNMPSVGAIVEYSATESPTFGHVAYVENVNADGSVNVSEYNYGCSHCYGVRCNIRPPRFINIHGTPPPPKFNLGDTVQVTGTAPSTLNVRGPNACDASIGQKADGSVGQIVAADSVRCDGGSGVFYNRWRVQWSDGLTGWSAEEWLVKVTAPCTYSLTPTSQAFTWPAGSGSFAVNAPAGCAWTAVSNAGWISLTSGATGSGNGTVSFNVSANPNTTPRSGTITVQGQTFTVNQSGGIPGDFNADGDVDQGDMGHMQPCVTGDAVTPVAPGCENADLDHDNDVDQSDFGLFQRCISGPNVPANPTCAS